MNNSGSGHSNLAASRLADVLERIAGACARYGRSTDDVTLIAVSKTHGADDVRSLANEGQRDFAENYLQEALGKIEDLTERRLCWHFIGHIQSNKCADIARHFDWVHSIDRFKIARRLGEAAAGSGKTLSALIQVNVQNEPGKSGIAAGELEALLDQAETLEGIRLRGLMVIPEPTSDFDAQRKPFADLRRLLERANRQGHNLDCLSMGMSADLEAAIAEGATHVRIGTALFGPRDYSQT